LENDVEPKTEHKSQSNIVSLINFP